MPIYDNNGTTDYQIGKVYDNNGTTDYQIGKVYDNNGTTSSLIYTAEETLSKTVSYNTHSNTYTLNWDTLHVTGYTNATYTLTISGSENIFYVGIGTSGASPGDTSVEKPTGSLVNYKSVNGSNPGTWTGTLSLDSSKTYYVYLGSYYGTTNGTVSATVIFS